MNSSRAVSISFSFHERMIDSVFLESMVGISRLAFFVVSSVFLEHAGDHAIRVAARVAPRVMFLRLFRLFEEF